MALVEVRQVSKHFKEYASTVPALSDVTLDIPEGAFTALSGPSGSGKTTLLNLVGCLDRPTSGTITLDGHAISSLSQQKLSTVRLYKIGFIFQDYNLIPTFSATENIEYVLWMQGVGTIERRKRSEEILKRFGIAAMAGRRPSQMSRGQQQRVAVARALAHKPKIVLGDELTANLDHKTGRELMEFLRHLNKNEGITFLFATHDPVMIDYAESVIRMLDGRLLEHAAHESKTVS